MKAVLILDEIPENCLDCELADCRYISDTQSSEIPYGIYCTSRERKIADSWLDLNVNDKRPDWCPLKELSMNDGLIYKLEWMIADEKSSYKRTILQEVIDMLKGQEEDNGPKGD